MKKIYITFLLLIASCAIAKAQKNGWDHIKDSVVNSIVVRYENDHAQDSSTISDELGTEDYGFYNKNIYLCRFTGWAQNGRWHYLIVTKNKTITSKIFDGRDLKTDLLELFKYLKETGAKISPVEKNRLIMDFVKNW